MFDGVDDYAWTENGPVVDTTDSFAVSAQVWLDAADVDKGLTYTALGQDASARSGFYLGYLPSCTATGGDVGTGCWAFRMSNTDGATTVVAAQSSKTVTPDQWVHLVGEFDATAKEIKLWVCSAGTPASPSLGNPGDADSASRTAAPWAATGPFTVGRGLSGGAPAHWWPGKIDNIRVFSGEVVDESKIRRLCQGAEATDFVDAGDSALDPTVVED